MPQYLANSIGPLQLQYVPANKILGGALTLGGVPGTQVLIVDSAGNTIGWIGPSVDPTSYAVAAVTASGLLVEIQTSAAVPYITGDLVLVNLPGLPPAYTQTQWQITMIDSTHFTLNSSTYASGYSGGGTVARVYNGAWFEQFACGGTSRSTAPLHTDSQGNLFITGGKITFTTSGGTTLTIDSTTDNITIQNGNYTALMTYYQFELLNSTGITISADSTAGNIKLSYAGSTISATLSSGQLVIADSSSSAQVLVADNQIEVFDSTGTNFTFVKPTGISVNGVQVVGKQQGAPPTITYPANYPYDSTTQVTIQNLGNVVNDIIALLHNFGITT
jgi:hypothetical protein